MKNVVSTDFTTRGQIEGTDIPEAEDMTFVFFKASNLEKDLKISAGPVSCNVRFHQSYFLPASYCTDIKDVVCMERLSDLVTVKHDKDPRRPSRTMGISDSCHDVKGNVKIWVVMTTLLNSFRWCVRSFALWSEGAVRQFVSPF